LQSLPESLLNLRIDDLNLKGNPALDLPESILKRPPKEILRYYFESRAGNGQPLLELKLLVVGRGKAGKTTLIKQLAGERPDAQESETHSIAIRELMIDCPGGQVRTRAWDFGGQEILHSTHQFFLTERSLYLLVLEPRTGTAQRDAEYWLKLIETQGNGSPVVVALNWSHNRRWQVDKVKLRRKFPFIVEFVHTDALRGEGIGELGQIIQQTIQDRMSDVWLPFPIHWREIKNEVAGMTGNFLTYDQFTVLCAGYGEDRPDAQADLAGILHALGLALYFGKDPRLHDTRVLNPGWVTGGCTGGPRPVGGRKSRTTRRLRHAARAAGG
jgi:internalin A